MRLEQLFIIAPLVIMFILFWVFMVIPEKKRQKKYNAMLQELRIHDKVQTNGGIIGKIVKINGNEIIIDSEGTRFRIAKSGISSKLESKSEKAES